MVIMDLTSSEIDRVGGIWAGMSGSPVYADDGRLIGAVAYGLACGASPVAGITPFEDMDDYLGDADRAREDQGRQGSRRRRSPGGSDVTARQAAQGFTQLPMALGVSGLTRPSGSPRARTPTGSTSASATPTSSAGPGGEASPDPSTVVAGGNIAAALSYGDITAAGVGTATSVCDGRVVGFGHPMTFGGTTTLSLHPADALYVQEDSLGVPFKVANLGDPAGTITDDRLAGITGGFGALPETTIDHVHGHQGRALPRGHHVRQHPGLGRRDDVQRAPRQPRPRGRRHHRRIGRRRTTRSPAPTPTARRSRSASATGSSRTSDITFDSAFDVADIVYGLTSIEGVTVDTVTMHSDVSADKSAYTITAVQQRKNGEWVKVSGKAPATIKAGQDPAAAGGAHRPQRHDVRQLQLRGAEAVPRQEGLRLRHRAATGCTRRRRSSRPSTRSPRRSTAQVRNDETQAQFSISNNKGERVKTVVSGAVDKVVNGERRVKVLIK